MKKLTLTFLFLSLSTSLLAQDIIITKDNKRIEARILREDNTVILYSLFNASADTTYLFSKKNISSITYENGKVVSFKDKEFKNVIRLKPFATVQSAFLEIVEIDLQYVRYVGHKVGIPLEFDFFSGLNDMGMGFALLTGFEYVPLTHRQKSGLFLQGLAGIIYCSSTAMGSSEIKEQGAELILNANVGYQLVTRQGFVFNIAVGPIYNTLTNKVAARISIDFGVAF